MNSTFMIYDLFVRLEHFYDHAGLLRIYGVAYKSSSGSISSIKNVFLVKLMEINCHLLLSSLSYNLRKHGLLTILLNMIAAALTIHINLVMVYYLLFIAHVWEDCQV